jgi:hypothetical protein
MCLLLSHHLWPASCGRRACSPVCVGPLASQVFCSEHVRRLFLLLLRAARGCHYYTNSHPSSPFIPAGDYCPESDSQDRREILVPVGSSIWSLFLFRLVALSDLFFNSGWSHPPEQKGSTNLGWYQPPGPKTRTIFSTHVHLLISPVLW